MPVTDPQHPQFPHGRAWGYRNGCKGGAACPATPTCKQVRDEENRLRKKRREAIPTNPRVNTAPTWRHLAELQAAVPDATPHRIAFAAGITPARLERIRTKQVVLRNEVKPVLALTPDDLAPSHAERACWIIRNQQAAGYPIPVQAQHAGLSVRHMTNLAHGTAKSVSVGIVTMLQLAADEHTRPDLDGVPADAIEQARKEAEQDGYYPPACYDEDGNLDPRAIPGHTWSVEDTRAGLHLDALRLYLTTELTLEEITERIGAKGDHVVQRAAQLAGLTELAGNAWKDRQAWVLAIVDDYDEMRIDVLHAAYKVGMPIKMRRTIREHPGYRAYMAEVADALRTLVLARVTLARLLRDPRPPVQYLEQVAA